jgi:hypothetical protein
MADDVLIATGVSGNPEITTATAEIGGVHHQVHFGGQRSRSDTFTGPATGTVVDASRHGCTLVGLQVKGTGGAASAWNVVLEVSLDGVNFAPLIAHDLDDGSVIATGSPFPVLYFRSRCVSVTLGGATNVVASIVGM